MIKIDSEQSLNEELSKNEKVLALFYASWCPYCIRFVPSFNEKIVDFKGATIIQVILDDYDNPIWDNYEIDAVPTIILFEKGKIAKRLDGQFGVGLTQNQLDSWLKHL